MKPLFEDFKEKVSVQVIGFDTSEEAEELGAENGIIRFAVSSKHIQTAFDWCEQQELTDFVINGMKVELGLYRNLKMVLNYDEDDIDELWN